MTCEEAEEHWVNILGQPNQSWPFRWNSSFVCPTYYTTNKVPSSRRDVLPPPFPDSKPRRPGTSRFDMHSPRHLQPYHRKLRVRIWL